MSHFYIEEDKKLECVAIIGRTGLGFTGGNFYIIRLSLLLCR